MGDDFDETLVPPRRPLKKPAASLSPDTDATVIPPATGARAESQPPVETITASAAFYQFRVGSRTEPITLDRPCFVGRRPSPPRIISGAVPRLLRVPSPLKEVSATHLELRQMGSSVIVTDLRSTNGSVVMVPGSVPRKLRQGESVVVSPGTLVDIGDDNVLQILPMQRVG